MRGRGTEVTLYLAEPENVDGRHRFFLVIDFFSTCGAMLRMPAAASAPSSRMDAPRKSEEGLLQSFAVGLLFEFRGGARGDDVAVIDDGDCAGPRGRPLPCSGW